MSAAHTNPSPAEAGLGSKSKSRGEAQVESSEARGRGAEAIHARLGCNEFAVAGVDRESLSRPASHTPVTAFEFPAGTSLEEVGRSDESPGIGGSPGTRRLRSAPALEDKTLYELRAHVTRLEALVARAESLDLIGMLEEIGGILKPDFFEPPEGLTTRRVLERSMDDRVEQAVGVVLQALDLLEGKPPREAA